MLSALGTLGRPGMVMMSPQIATMNPAPAASRTSRTGTVWWVGAPSWVHLVAANSEPLCLAADWTVFPRVTAREFRWKGTTLLADGEPCRDVPPSFVCPQITQSRMAARDVMLAAVFENELKHMREACELAIQHGYALYPSH